MVYRAVFVVLLVVLWSSCSETPKKTLQDGLWRAELEVQEDEKLPFKFALRTLGEGIYQMEVYNAEETITVDEISLQKDSIYIKMPVFEGYLAGVFTDSTIQGTFIKESLDRKVPFKAQSGKAPRFETKTPPQYDLSGNWEVLFEYDTDSPYPAKGIFEQSGGRLQGTFRTTTGDYRFLEGVVDGDSLYLSTFDGAHAFLFTAGVTDSTMQGRFYSGNHYLAYFQAKRNANFELPDADTLTFLKPGYDRFDFAFPESPGANVSLSDASFKDKVVLVQLMGTWCPNCLDESQFLVDYLNRKSAPDLKVVALAFEYAKTEEKAFAAIQRFKDRVGVTYPVLLAQYGSSSKTKAQEKLPMLNHVLSYPTTLFIDKKGVVRKIHTGFNGPATGAPYQAFKKDFEETLNTLLSE
ncbi:MAG: TlpA disulfide reductase family protein [Bacteroidota bacterium]